MTDQTTSKKPTDFNSIRIQLASPEIIRSWSHGEVTKPETINYRSFKPERDGLFCERIFGPVKDWECHCGKYKRIRYKGVVCDRCGVEVTQSRVRREWLGHIELAVPVSHIWYFKSLPSRIGYLLDLSIRDLERVLYYEQCIVLDPGDDPATASEIIDKPVAVKTLLTEDELALLQARDYSINVGMGAGAIKELLNEINIDDLSAELRTQAKVETSVQKKQEALKRLKVVEAFRQSSNQPSWMILDVLPVIPPDLRPLVPLEGGRFATSDLNDLYRRVINRNNRLKKLIEIKAPEVILRNEKRMLQEAVDALFDNGRRSRAVRGDGNRSLKSLSDLLKGKQGRFRQNLLGKRVDYSGRSVIVVGPELKLHQCGLPKNMALELFKPFIIRKLGEKGLVQTVKSAKKLVERERPEVWDVLEEIIQDHCVLLNRAPTLHRLGIQAFQPLLIEGKAIKIHPLVCAAFNADFDGDQMAVHVPLSMEAQIEARVLMLASNNLLKPADGSPIVADKPQDIVLGCYYLTKIRPGTKGEGKVLASPEEALMAYDHGVLDLHALIQVRMNGKREKTTVGRLIFNRILPPEIGRFVNEQINDKRMKAISTEVHTRFGNRVMADYVDRLKDLGYQYATKAGITVGMDDVIVPPEKAEVIGKALVQVEDIKRQFDKGIITDGERYNKVIDVWQHATTNISKVMFETLRLDSGGFNPVFMMRDSGARGSVEQISQLGGMRGLMNKPQKKITGAVGEIIESPIVASFKEGLSVLEYFISTHGGRKGLADTALKTAEAGYLTRRMVDVAQDVIVTEEDCGTILGIEIAALKEGEEVVEPLVERIVGRALADDVEDPSTGELLASAGDILGRGISERIDDAGVERVRIRSVLTCESRRGICAKCYGQNLATGKAVNLGEAVGVVAAQSIGEPGTQLTLRTFHIGGTASSAAEQSETKAKNVGTVHLNESLQGGQVVNREGKTVSVVRNGEIDLSDEQNRQIGRYQVPYGATLLVKDGEQIRAGQTLYEWDPYNSSIMTDRDGRAMFRNIVFREELDLASGHRLPEIIEHRDRSLSPHIEILDGAGNRVRNYAIPVGAHLFIADGQQLMPGDVLVKIPRERRKTRDITGGLPRVAELFEARRPKEPAVVTEIDGVVRFGEVIRGSRELAVTSEDGEERRYLVPYGKHLRVHDADRVNAGESLSEGAVNPHDILRILGAYKVQEYLVNQIQEVYRLQGVRINDKHIEVIVRQMLQKVKVVDPGDTNFIEGEQVDKWKFADENERVISEGGNPATFQPVLLGIAKASLMTDSFISAASFQETTRVLTDAAVHGKVDHLLGLKENVIIGHLIPAGTGVARYRRMTHEVLPGSPVPAAPALVDAVVVNVLDDYDNGGSEEARGADPKETGEN